MGVINMFTWCQNKYHRDLGCLRLVNSSGLFGWSPIRQSIIDLDARPIEWYEEDHFIEISIVSANSHTYTNCTQNTFFQVNAFRQVHKASKHHKNILNITKEFYVQVKAINFDKNYKTQISYALLISVVRSIPKCYLSLQIIHLKSTLFDYCHEKNK